jgi:YggT family protein
MRPAANQCNPCRPDHALTVSGYEVCRFMYVFGYFLMALAKVLDYVLFFYMLIIIARAVLSWVNPDPYNPIVRFIYGVTEPVIYQVRSRIPSSFGGIDFSPVIVILIIYFLQIFVVQSLLRFSHTLL